MLEVTDAKLEGSSVAGRWTGHGTRGDGRNRGRHRAGFTADIAACLQFVISAIIASVDG